MTKKIYEFVVRLKPLNPDDVDPSIIVYYVVKDISLINAVRMMEVAHPDLIGFALIAIY